MEKIHNPCFKRTKKFSTLFTLAKKGDTWTDGLHTKTALYCSIREANGEGYRSIYLLPTKKVQKILQEMNSIVSDDNLYIQIVKWNDKAKECGIWIKYNSIIGQRMLAIIKGSEVPD